jgi:proline dehydrogenase
MSILERPLRAAILAAADSTPVHRFVKRYGMRLGARRFVAGETADEFLDVAQAVNARGFAVACGILGEGVADPVEATDAADQYCALLRAFAERGLHANVAFKLSHVGLDIDPDLAFENASRIARAALETGNTMRMDMEQSRYVDPTLAMYRRLRATYENVGFVLQSYLFRSAADLRALMPLRPNVRLVKGAYLEPPELAFAKKSDVDENYAQLAEDALAGEGYTAIATHDPVLIERIAAYAERLRLPRQGRFEFQMLYGVASAQASSLVERGYRVRLAVPFGGYWFPYLMRRLAERPANLAFFLKGAFSR